MEQGSGMSVEALISRPRQVNLSELTGVLMKFPLLLFVALCALCLRSAATLADSDLPDVSGTGWQLVEIQSMDDTVRRPEEGGRYRLVFGIDGAVSVEAGCNRATGMISVFDPPRLQFSDLAATQALCGPESLSERFLAELGWVRSYVYRDNQLYLATMADGSIIKFAPMPADEAVATVESLSLVTEDVDALRGTILSRLLDDYAADAGISVSDAEIDDYLAAMDRRLRDDLGDDYDDRSSLTAEEQADLDRMRRQMAEGMMRSWMVNKALYEQYGGRIIFQQLGPEPLDAYRAFLEQAQAAGRFSIARAELEAAFWAFFHDEERHSFMPEDSEDAARAFTIPPWASD
jgi:heat shock protein HslJ